MMVSREELQREYARIIAKAWSDEEFKGRLLADPKAALKEEGIDVPEGITLRVFENTPTEFNFILPPKPDSSELREEDLAQVGGGIQYGCCMAATGCIGCQMDMSYGS